MKANSLKGALALVACLMAAPASAVSLNPKGLGQVLIYPYYTVNKNQDTLMSVGNASEIGKVVRVEFYEGVNGRFVSFFDVFLSPHDVWTAAITQTADDGGAQLLTSDTSCTYAVQSPVLFTSGMYDGTGAVPADSGPQGITRTREGYIVLVNSGDITPGSPTDVRTRHVQDGNPGAGTPPGCDELSNTNVAPDLVAPSNALYGSAAVVNVAEGTYFAYNADAVAGFTDIPIFGSTAEIRLYLQDANSDEATNGVARAYVSDNNGRPLALDYAFGIDALSAVFMSDAIYNEYLVDASLGANTDWVVTFPTKPFYTDRALYNPTDYTIAIPPFDRGFNDGVANVAVQGRVYDREEGSITLLGCDDCTPPLPPPSLPYVVTVMSFLIDKPGGTPSGVFGSSLGGFNVAHFGSSGLVSLDLVSASTTHYLATGIDTQGAPVTLLGLPATGFMAYNIINTQAQPGMLANYGGAFHHRATTSCIGADPGCEAPITDAQTPQ